jgi:hypothetical protein
MPRIRCQYLDCDFQDDGFCSAAAVEIDPDSGCVTYRTTAEAIEVDDWTDDDELEDWDDVEEDDIWLDDNEDF